MYKLNSLSITCLVYYLITCYISDVILLILNNLKQVTRRNRDRNIYEARCIFSRPNKWRESRKAESGYTPDPFINNLLHYLLLAGMHLSIFSLFFYSFSRIWRRSHTPGKKKKDGLAQNHRSDILAKMDEVLYSNP